jgi:protein-tyrosine-phosphatase
MASAFAQFLAGDRLEVFNAGLDPAEHVQSDMVKVMQEKGIDMGFRIPKTIDEVMANDTPDFMITMNGTWHYPRVPAAQTMEWDLPDPGGKSLKVMRDVRDDIEKRVHRLIDDIA